MQNIHIFYETFCIQTVPNLFWYFITLYMRVLKLPMIKNIASIYLIIFIIFNAFFNYIFILGFLDNYLSDCTNFTIIWIIYVLITLNIIYLNFNLITRFINFVRSIFYSFECIFVSRQRKKDLISFYYIFTIFIFSIGVRFSILVYMKLSIFDFFALYFCRQWLYYFLL